VARDNTEVDNVGVSEQDAEDAFNAGMRKIVGDRAPAATEPEKKDDDAQDGGEDDKQDDKGNAQKAEPDAPADESKAKPADAAKDVKASKADKSKEEPVKEEREFAGLKESEWKAIAVKAAQFDELNAKMTKLSDTTAGTIGSLKQAVKAMQDKPASAGKPLKVVKEQLKRLTADFPELAERLAEDLSEVLMPDAGTAAAKLDPEEVNKIVEAKLADFKFRSDVQRLDTLHGDRKEIIASNDYKVWFGLQPVHVQDAIKTSREVDFVSSALTAFKTWRDRTAQGPAVAADAGKAAKQRDKRLDNAIVPSGTAADQGKKVLTAEDAFEAGLKKARGNRR